MQVSNEPSRWFQAGVLATALASAILAGCGGNSADSPPKITSQPSSETVTAGESASFSVLAIGEMPLNYQWQQNGADIVGANSPSYIIATTIAAQSGETFQVIVSNAKGSIISNAATLTVDPAAAVSPSVTVLTYHNDNARTGLNANETILTTGNVNSAKFGNLGSLSVTGLVDAEPLYVPGLTIGGAKHNVVFVATEHDMLYAFDADTPGAPLWQLSVIPGSETPSDDRGCGQVTPEIGVTSTPVIDLKAGPNGTIFVVSMSKDSSNNYHHRLHAIDLVTHAELNGGPTEVQASVAGSGTGSSGGMQTFNPGSYEERAALLLLNGAIYTTWTSHCDAPNYTSWVIGYSESTLQRVSVLNLTANGATQNGQEGGIWMSGYGPAADASGFIYLLVGNGTFDTTLDGNGFPNNQDYGNSFMKLSTAGNSLTVADYFAMNNSKGTAESESSADTDLGSGGAMVLPDVTDNQGTTHHLAVGAGKDTNLYIVNRDNMGKFANNDSGLYQRLDSPWSGQVKSGPAFFNNTVYYGPVGSPLMAFPVSNAKLPASPAVQSANSFGYPGTTPSISANGSANGIVWAIENGSTGTLHAYDATNLANELYNSNQAGARDQFPDNGNDKFVTPMIANGKVYVGAPNAVVVFGLLP
jgi:hypothetical protein